MSILFIQNKCWPENPNERHSMADCAKHLQRILGVAKPDFASMQNNQSTAVRHTSF